MTSIAAGLLLAGAIAARPASGAPVHEKGVLKLANRTVAAGDSVALAGEKFTRNAALKLVLVGVAGRFELGDARTDSAGRFERALLVPADLKAGPYRLVAVATDGDEVASLDVTIVEVVEAAEHAGHDMTAEPSHEPLALERARSPWVTGGAWVGIALALVAGVALLRRPRHTSH